MASHEFEKVLQLLRSRPTDKSATVAQRRANLEHVSERVAKDVECRPVAVGGVEGEWLVPPGAVPGRVLLYLHGGGFVMGSVRTHRATIARIAQASHATALAVDYRLAPEHPFPSALEDATAAYLWLLDQGYHPPSLAVVGDSAGGGLALATLVGLRDEGVPLPAAAVTLSPWADLALTGGSVAANASKDVVLERDELVEMAGHYLQGLDPATPRASPLYADLRGLPPLLIQVGGAEVLLDDARRVAERVEAAGGAVTFEIWDEMFHLWHLFAKRLPEGRDAIERIGGFLQAHTGDGGA